MEDVNSWMLLQCAALNSNMWAQSSLENCAVWLRGELDNQKQTPTLQVNWSIGQLALFPEQTYLGKKPDNISDGGKLEGLDNIRMTRVRLGP